MSTLYFPTPGEQEVLDSLPIPTDDEIPKLRTPSPLPAVPILLQCEVAISNLSSNMILFLPLLLQNSAIYHKTKCKLIAFSCRLLCFACDLRIAVFGIFCTAENKITISRQILNGLP
jgi:hypothetical protein